MEHEAYARIGLLGNPSDGYFGRTIAVAISNFSARVQLKPSESLVIVPHPYHDLGSFNSIDHLVWKVRSEGYYGGVRLLMAACKVFYEYCSSHGIKLHDRNFQLSYETNIPRQAGLSGSSALVCATMKCLLDFYGVSEHIPVEDRPQMILDAEAELGITAGLQDRVAQVYGGVVYMDFNEEQMRATGHGIYTPMDPALLPPLYIIYAQNPSESGKIHSTVKKRWLAGDVCVRNNMLEVAELAFKGRAALQDGDFRTLAELMNRNFDLRRAMFGDEALGDLNLKMVDTARSVGAACKFTGSGGACVAFCPDGEDQVNKLKLACQAAGFTVEPVQVAPGNYSSEFSSSIHVQDLSNRDGAGKFRVQ